MMDLSYENFDVRDFDVRDDTVSDMTEEAPLHCDSRFSIHPNPPYSESLLVVEFADPVGYVYVGLSLSGPGAPVSDLIRVYDSGDDHVWKFHVTHLSPGILTMTFTADHGATSVGSCSVNTLEGSAGELEDVVEVCIPDCNGVICGGDDGCGNPCVGGYRNEHGGVSDCRLEGDCGCGVEDNSNMVCLENGRCRVHCPCDCLPPIDRDAHEVADLNKTEACRLVFRDSGDPTVWDYETDTPLCPLDHDPPLPDRCTECPPCHRNHPPECSWAQWCTCRDERWIDGYRSECCAEGDEYCF